MIPKVRIYAADFIGTDMESSIWSIITDTAQQNSLEFKLLFHTEKTQFNKILSSISKHEKELEGKMLRTEIKTSAAAHKEFVFLEATTGPTISNCRFSYKDPAPINVIGAMSFLNSHFEFMQRNKEADFESKRKQKRNDGESHGPQANFN